ncbi:DUF2299 domain-containing protein [Saccharolobus solfataricus]|nr:DUF2299 family protein [Saccharolobus solfataricus]AKA75010.1 DUF2299 domain-containing protein [Saccharolobus solfataricus]AKA77702.1 DUF2299 domain-containing protein [Saccharolobus solfataricus]AKA80394.1 DUF2299 domain-containing protein [Saccharolobus solfataricus]AZF69466.1 DUF2299 domain-containing protein [Saccharolobus solfataricus]AZF72086.1 DUF2299 domain-containing protein [Saccharolobus solfataricus]
MVSDSEVFNWFKELGMRVEQVKSGDLYFHFTVAPPMGGLPVSVIRPRPDSTYYIVAVLLELDQERLRNNKRLVEQIKRELLRMNVEFFFTPNDKEPKSIQVARLMFTDGLTKNEALNNVTLVKNSALLVLQLINES